VLREIFPRSTTSTRDSTLRINAAISRPFIDLVNNFTVLSVRARVCPREHAIGQCVAKLFFERCDNKRPAVHRREYIAVAMFGGRRAREIEGRSAALGAYHGQICYVTCIRRGNASHDFAVLDKRLAIEIHRLAVESGKDSRAEIGISILGIRSVHAWRAR